MGATSTHARDTQKVLSLVRLWLSVAAGILLDKKNPLASVYYQTKRISLTKSQWSTPQLLATIGGCVCGGFCCGLALGDISDEIGPIGVLGGLPVLGALYFARQSDSNVYLKLKADKPESSAQKDVEAKQSSSTPTKVPEIPPEIDPASPLRALPTGYTY